MPRRKALIYVVEGLHSLKRLVHSEAQFPQSQ